MVSDNRPLIWILAARPLLGVWQQTTHLDPYSLDCPWYLTTDHSSGSLQPVLSLVSDNRLLIWIPRASPLHGVWQQTTLLDSYSQASPCCLTTDHSSGSLQPGLSLLSDNRPLIWIPTARSLLGVCQQTTHLDPYSQASPWCLTADHSSGSLQPGPSLVSVNRPLIWIPTARPLLGVWQQTSHLDPYSQASTWCLRARPTLQCLTAGPLIILNYSARIEVTDSSSLSKSCVHRWDQGCIAMGCLIFFATTIGKQISTKCLHECL